MAPTAATEYDIAIIGGGIAGAAIARDASLRGLRVVLFEQNTIGSGTSSKSSRLIHGGIRYLEIAWDYLVHGQFVEAWTNFKFVFLALRECRILEKIAPSLIHTIPIILPIYRSDPRPKWMIMAGCWLYSWLARLSGPANPCRFFHSPSALNAVIPGLKQEGLLGGVQIWDRLTDDLRLTQAVAASARDQGATLCEHTLVLSYRYEASHRYFVVVTQSATGVKQEARARFLVNASGAWVDQVRENAQEKQPKLVVPIAGAHIHVRKFVETSLLLQAKDRRIFFVINVGDEARIGTTERKHMDPNHVVATDSEIDYLIDSLNFYFPNRNFGRKDVLRSDAGIRPLYRSSATEAANKISREHQIVEGPCGVLHVVGVKLTDHRRAAREVLERLYPQIKLRCPHFKKHSETEKLPL